jgi:hypothetical protein
VYVVVNFLKAGLMHMPVGVRGPVVVGMGVFVLNVVVFVCGVRVCVGGIAMLMFVRMRPFMGVLLRHSNHLLRSKRIVLLAHSGRATINRVTLSVPVFRHLRAMSLG